MRYAGFVARMRSDFETQCYHFCVSCAGYLLVGGRSSRMGSDKALLPFRDSRLGQSVAGLVERAAGGVVLVGNPQLAPLFGYPAIPDLYPGEGPLGGILTALGHTASDWNLLVACDMPGLSAEFLAGLMDAAARSGADALVPVGPGGRRNPCARSTIAARAHRSAAPSPVECARLWPHWKKKTPGSPCAAGRLPKPEYFKTSTPPRIGHQWAPRYAAK